MTVLEGALNAALNQALAKFLRLGGSGASGSREWGQRAQNVRHFQISKATGWRSGWWKP